PHGAQDEVGFVPTDRTWIARLPQEDMCQATGTPPTLRYESDGGPSMLTCLELLGNGERADIDRAHFALAQFAFWLLAATDGHAKNFSIFHHRGGTFRLTPLYDVISAWPIIGKGQNLIPAHKARLAMGLGLQTNTHYRLSEIRAPCIGWAWPSVAARRAYGNKCWEWRAGSTSHSKAFSAGCLRTIQGASGTGCRLE
ncbi:MAG: HipA domain-containing protein, partial [Betaproteobacteria bacterium]|nr:HipA domain-containing protein [Betaproteobacteria bacterium]